MGASTTEPISPAPLVSIITATYNWSSVLRYAIQSVLWQTLQDFEILVIGDGCTDDSGEVVASFNDPRVRWHNLPQNTGHQSIPNNTGLAMARGKYIAYLGHDDVWLPTHLARLVAVIEHDETDLANTLCVLIGPPGSEVRFLAGIPLPDGRHKSIPPSSLMHRRILIDQIGNWQEYTQIHAEPEADLLRRAELHGSKIATARYLTVFKFPSAWRRNSYREKRCDEQAEYVRRIQTEPDFMEHELTAVAIAYSRNKTWIPIVPKQPRISPPGWRIEQFRHIRGLDARPLAKLTLVQRLFVVVYPFTYPVRKIRRVLIWLMRRGA